MNIVETKPQTEEQPPIVLDQPDEYDAVLPYVIDHNTASATGYEQALWRAAEVRSFLDTLDIEIVDPNRHFVISYAEAEAAAAQMTQMAEWGMRTRLLSAMGLSESWKRGYISNKASTEYGNFKPRPLAEVNLGSLAITQAIA